jgi:hypothetical protein
MPFDTKGNFAAHPIKRPKLRGIIEVGAGEAE